MARPMVPEDIHLLRQVTACALHPDGARVAYTVSWADQATDSNRNQLWLHDGTSRRQLTFGHSDTSPTFSPDGRWLAYLSAGQGVPSQLKTLPLEGGEPLVLTMVDDGVGEPVWLPDSSGLLFSAVTRPAHEQGKTAAELAAKPEPRQITTVEYRFNGRGWVHNRWRHIFVVRIPTSGEPVAAPIQLTDGPWDDYEAQPHPDGKRVVFLSARHDDREWSSGNDLWSTTLRGGKPKALTNGGKWLAVRCHPDGKCVVLVGRGTRHSTELAGPHVLTLDGTDAPKRIGDGEISFDALVSPPHMQVDGDEVLMSSVRRGAVHIDRYSIRTGQRETVVGGKRSTGSFAQVGKRLVFVASGTNSPCELYDSAGAIERRLTKVAAPFLREVALSPMIEATTTAADGYPVHAMVCAPTTTGKHPGLLYIHGGPLSHYGWGFNSEFQIAAAAGYVVVGPNPRGSDGYGHAHAAAPNADWGNLDWIDVQAGADYLASRSDVDAKRLGIGGGSYGGFMTAWATARTHRFKAALVERAVTNWVTMEATSDIPWFMRAMLKTDTLTDIEPMRRQSPITYVSDVRTPTLVIHSEEDWRCPIEQGEQWFGALRRMGVETVFVRVPGENHDLTRTGRPSLRVSRFHIVHGWYAKFLGGGVFPKPG
jgi:dipeptidyl aminopeptidase/acylaminoacyl peptidase